MMFVAGSIDARVHRAAQRLLDAGLISNVRVLQDGRVVTGIAYPDPELPAHETTHRVYIRYRQQDTASGELAVEGECSCGELSPCSHVAAVAMFAAGESAARPAGKRHDANDSAPRSSRQGLCYLLEDIDGICRLSVWVAEISAGREIASGARLFARRPAEAGDDYPRYVDPLDRPILQALPRQQVERWSLQGDSGSRLLRQVVATGRAVWQRPQGKTLCSGAPREVDMEWRPAANGEQRMHPAGPDPLHLIVSIDAAAYIDNRTCECGPLQLTYPVDLLRRYWNQPGLSPEAVTAVNDWLRDQPRAASFPRPREIRVRRYSLSTLRGQLTLSAGPQAILNFLYNDHLIPSHSLHAEDDTVRHLNGDLHEIARDREAEHALQEQLAEVMRTTPQTRDAWLGFMANGLPKLRDRGWTIAVDAAFPYRLAPLADWYADVAASRRAEWFDLQLGIMVDGQPVNLLPALVDYLQAAAATTTTPSLLSVDQMFVPLADGRYLPVPTSRLRRIAETLVELFDRDALNDRQALTLPLSQAGRLALLTEDAIVPTLRSADPALIGLIDEIKHFSGIRPLPPPPSCRAILREYQREGLGWLQFLRRYRLGGILADDMGLGKTLQTLAHLATEKTQGLLGKPVLIVAPVSVLGNWQMEIRRFTPSLTAITLQGARRQRLFASLDTVDIIIIGYPSLLFDGEILLAREFSFLILDEAQTIKNPRAKVSQAARALRAEHRLCLTGTPMENHLGDLWSLCDFVQPGLLGTERSFQRHYRTPIEKGGNTLRAQALRRRIAPFLLRRTKDAVARELPPKTEIIQSIGLEQAQRDLYDGIRLSMHRRVREAIELQGLARSRITMLDALLKLRQACCDPRLVAADPQTAAVPSAKLDWLSTALPELIADGRRILLFSQFTSMLRLIESVLAELSIPYCLLTGDTQDRPSVIERFQSGAVPLFLLSLKAGGAGLNLTAADTVIHYDPWWNPAVETQATDRAHRIGQDKPVFVYKLIAQGTVEEKILQLQADKHALVSQLYSAGNAAPSLLCADDLAALFDP